MPDRFLRPCSGGCGRYVAKGACPACRSARERTRPSRRERGYGPIWDAWRPVFISALAALGILPVCGAALPDGPKTSDSSCKAQGLWSYSSASGSSLQFDHEPPLTNVERKDPLKVCDPRRIQLLCKACHDAKTARQRSAA